MPDPVTALVVGGTQIAGGALSANASGKAAGQQAAASQAGIDETRRQFDAMQKLLEPYTQAGVPALQGQQNLLGLGGADAQGQAIQQLQGSPMFQQLTRQGEDAILQNASATGGLRGGNTQAALAQFRPNMLSSLIDQQYSRLGGLANMGQNSAAMTGQAGIGAAGSISGLLEQQGAARAGGTLGKANAFGQVLNLPTQFLGMQYGAGAKPGFGGLF